MWLFLNLANIPLELGAYVREGGGASAMLFPNRLNMKI